MTNPYPHLDKVRNLVFEGGGVKGIAYLGAIKRLYKSIDHTVIQGVGGTSAGAITAMAVSFGLDANGIQSLVSDLDYRKIRQQPTAKSFPKLNWRERLALKIAAHVFGRDIWSVYGLFHDYGWYSSDYFYGWLKQQIGTQLNSDGTETFAQYEAAMKAKLGRYIDLRVHATDVPTRSTKVLSLGNTPTLEVAKAIRMSMSIPLFFNSIEYKGQVYCDGGVIANYPIDIFANGQDRFATLGFSLCTPEGSCAASDSPNNDPAAPEKTCKPEREVDNLPSYIEAVFSSLLVASSEVRPDDVDRSVRISNYCVNTTDFDIEPQTADYNGLLNNGFNATDRFLTDWDAAGMSCD